MFQWEIRDFDEKFVEWILVVGEVEGGEIGEPFEETRKVRTGCIFDND